MIRWVSLGRDLDGYAGRQPGAAGPLTCHRRRGDAFPGYWLCEARPRGSEGRRPRARMPAEIIVVAAEATSAGTTSPATPTPQTRMIVREPASVAAVAFGFV